MAMRSSAIEAFRQQQGSGIDAKRVTVIAACHKRQPLGVEAAAQRPAARGMGLTHGGAQSGQ